ncbi:MAG: hypothetical protein WD229_18960, partial [Pirellulales bacterium]
KECAYYILNCKEAMIMTALTISWRSIFLSLVAMSVVQSTAQAADEMATGEIESPLLIARAFDKPEATKYDLQYKLKRGDVLRYGVVHRASIRSTIDESTQSAQTKTDSIKLWKVTDVLPKGEIEFMSVVERVHMVNQLPDHDPAEYDSEQDTTPPPGFEDAAKAVGVPLSVVRITPRGKVVRRDTKLRGHNLDEDAPVAVRLPEQPVAIGDTWDDPLDVTVSIENGGSKSIETRRHHKLTNVANGIATIEVTYQVLSPVDAEIECQLVQRLMEGEVRFDIKAGRMIGQQMDIDKRILGFAGPTSSMQYIMRMEEKLLKTESTVAGTPSVKSTTSRGPATRTTPSRSTNRRSSQRTHTNRR